MQNNAETEKKVIKCLDRIRPYLQHDGGDVEYVKFVDGIVYIRMSGACEGCGYVDSDISDGIEAMLLEEVPGVIGVENIHDESAEQ